MDNDEKNNNDRKRKHKKPKKKPLHQLTLLDFFPKAFLQPSVARVPPQPPTCIVISSDSDSDYEPPPKKPEPKKEQSTPAGKSIKFEREKVVKPNDRYDKPKTTPSNSSTSLAPQSSSARLPESSTLIDPQSSSSILPQSSSFILPQPSISNPQPSTSRNQQRPTSGSFFRPHYRIIDSDSDSDYEPPPKKPEPKKEQSTPSGKSIKFEREKVVKPYDRYDKPKKKPPNSSESDRDFEPAKKMYKVPPRLPQSSSSRLSQPPRKPEPKKQHPTPAGKSIKFEREKVVKPNDRYDKPKKKPPNSSESDSDFEPAKKMYKVPPKNQKTIKKKPEPMKKTPKPKNEKPKPKPAGKCTKFKRVKEVKPEDQQAQIDFSSIKLKLNTILKDEKDKVQQQISILSIKATQIASLASMLLLAKVNEFVNNQQFQQFFESDVNSIVEDCFFEVLDPIKHTQGRVRTTKYPQYMLPQFHTRVTQANIILPNNNNMGNTFKYLNQMYCTNFQTNITTHARRRVQKFFNTFADVTHTERKSTVEFLFYQNTRRRPSQLLLNRLAALDNRYTHLRQAGCLYELENGLNWFFYVPLFIHIQRHIHTYNMNHAQEWLDENNGHQKNGKNRKKYSHNDKKKKTHKSVRHMNIIPLCKYRRQHVRIDTEGLYRIVAALKLLPKQPDNPRRNITSKEFETQQSFFWDKYFKMPTIQQMCDKSKVKTFFHNQIHTDGVSASVLYETGIKENSNNQVRIEKIREKYKNGIYKYEVPIDFGYNTYIAAIRRNIQTRHERNITLKSKQFHRLTKNNLRKKKFNKLANEYEQRASQDRATYQEPPSPAGNYWHYIEHRLRFWTEGIDIYTTHEYASMSFNKYTNTQSTIDKIIHSLTNKSPALIIFGGAEFAANSPIKGHVRCPGVRKIIKASKKYPGCDYLFVDEYMTSQHCGICCRRYTNQDKSARFKMCSACIPDPEFQPAQKIITNHSRRYLQQARKLSNGDRVSKIKVTYPAFPKPSQKTTWQRDISAARLIGYKATKCLLNQPIDGRLMRSVAEPVAYSDEEDFVMADQLPSAIIW